MPYVDREAERQRVPSICQRCNCLIEDRELDSDGYLAYTIFTCCLGIWLPRKKQSCKKFDDGKRGVEMKTLARAEKMAENLNQYAEDLVKQEALKLLGKYPEQLNDYTACMGVAYFNFTTDFAAMVRQDNLSPSDYIAPSYINPLSGKGYNDDYYEPDDEDRIEVNDEMLVLMSELEDDASRFFDLVEHLTGECGVGGLYHDIEVRRNV